MGFRWGLVELIKFKQGRNLMGVLLRLQAGCYSRFRCRMIMSRFRFWFRTVWDHAVAFWFGFRKIDAAMGVG
jgi:hypothetical protein